MATYCDVALPVPLDRVFTYLLDPDETPPVGGRVVVPFRSNKLIGIVTRLHDQPPQAKAKQVERVLDQSPILPPDLMELGQWIARYYLAPLGEVLRGMLPLAAEVRRRILFRITELGKETLFAGAELGTSRRSQHSPEEQGIEYAVLDYLSNGEAANRRSLERATGANPELLRSMLRKKWIAREEEAVQRDASRLERYAAMADGAGSSRLNENQTNILAELAGAGGALPIRELRRLPVPQTTLNTLVRRGLVRIEERPAEFHFSSLSHSEEERSLNAAQQTALASITPLIERHEFGVRLLHGVTGSGKTAVYMAAMQHALKRGYSAILLVPEIGLTPAMAAEIHFTFGSDAALLHSALTPEERAEQWQRIRQGQAKVVVGTRSAVFAPVAKLGLVIVDEEHDSSYKQEAVPRYHARDVAIMRAKANSAAVVLGSATPSLESWRNARIGKYTLIEMTERVNHRPMPMVELVDMRREYQETGKDSLFSRALIDETRQTLDRGEQVIILLNRRGYSFVVLCRSCGEKVQCENCAISLTYHKSASSDGNWPVRPAGQRLRCHYCGYSRTVPQRCPSCDSEHLFFLGAGSEQGEERLRELFPDARVGRMDRDTVRGRQAMEQLLSDLHAGRINLLVGTQMIAKGHDIPGVTLVGVVGADYALALPDYRAAERVFQLLTQVSGRAGRGELPGRVIVETYHPDHYAIACAASHSFEKFLATELKFRRLMRYPPFCALANILIFGPRLDETAAWAAKLGKWFAARRNEGVRVLGPATAPIARIQRMYRFHFLLKSAQRGPLAAVLRAAVTESADLGIPRRNLIVDVDPVNLM